MSYPEYKSRRNRVWENQSLTLEGFAERLNPYLGGTYKNIGDSGAATTIDWSAAKVQELFVNINTALTFTNGTPGSELSLLLANNSVAKTITWPSNVRFNQNQNPQILTSFLAGSFDPTFTTGSGPNSTVTFVRKLSTGKILISGQFTTYNGVYTGRVARLNANGTLDTTWTYNDWISYTDNIISDLIELPNGNLLVGGNFANFGSPGNYGNNCMQLLTANGVRITHPSDIFAGGQSVNSLGIQSDGKIIAAGNFSGTYSSQNMLRINPDFTIDNTFYAFFDSIVRSIIVKSNDTIIAGGNFSTVNGNVYGPLVLLAANGTPIPFFSVAIPYGYINKLLLNSDDTLIAVGNFGTPYGSNIFKCNSLGQQIVGWGANYISGEIYDITKTNNGTLVIIGTFTNYNNQPNYFIAFLNPNTAGLSNMFTNAYPGFNNTTRSVTIQSNGNILVGGNYNNYMYSSSQNLTSITVLPQDKAFTKVDFQYNGQYYIGSF